MTEVLDEQVKTLGMMVEEAVASGYGTKAPLRSLFVKWQQFGLLSGPVRKEARRGGAGLWHPMQAALFEFYLANRREGINLITLSNAPVGIWLLGWEGVETRQAQQAVAYGCSSILPERIGKSWEYGPTSNRGKPQRGIGERSALTQSSDRAAMKLAPDDAKRRNPLQRILRAASTDIPYFGLTMPTFVAAFTGARPEAPKPVSERVGASIYQMLSDRYLALEYISQLTKDRKPILEFWEWARSFWQWNTEDYLGNIPRLQSLKGLGDLFEDPHLEEVLRLGTPYLLGMLGAGIRALRGDVSPAIQKFGLSSVTVEDVLGCSD